MIDLLSRWNRWGTAVLRSGHRRDVTEAVSQHLGSPDVLALVGPRRAGKTTVLFQVLDHLEAQGVSAKACLHLNLEEPGLAPEAGPDLLERAYRTWREEIWPKGRGFLLLDEVQAVPGWERWVRARKESEDVKILVTGSSSSLLSRELGTLLTGRHLEFRVHPLSFSELLRFRGIAAPQVGRDPQVMHTLSGYLRFGALPEMALEDHEERRSMLLSQYLDDIVHRDISLRHAVRNVAGLRAMAVSLLTQTATLVSFQRIARTHGVSLDTARAWVGHLQEAWLVDVLPFHSLHAGERQHHPQKLHAVDTGVRNAVTLHPSQDRGRIAETAVVAGLRRAGFTDLAWWKGRGEIDVVVRERGVAIALVQVCVEGNPAREEAALAEAAHAFPEAAPVLVGDQGVPLWRFLLDPAGYSRRT